MSDKNEMLQNLRRMIADATTGDERNRLISDVATVISRPTTRRVIGTFSLPHDMGGGNGRREFAFHREFRRQWGIRVLKREVTSSAGDKVTYRYWSAVRRKPSNYKRQEYVSLGREDEWTPTAAFMEAFNEAYATRREKPTRAEVKRFVASWYMQESGVFTQSDGFDSLLDF